MDWKDLAIEAQSIGTISALITVFAVIVGGRFALTRYRRDVRLRAAELLLKMEEEYRQILPTCIDFEHTARYKRVLVPVLQERNEGSLDSDNSVCVLLRLDRCLRFFFLCTVLNADLKVEETVIARAYYYYLAYLAHASERVELQNYVKNEYPRLNTWIERHRVALEEYRQSGKWDPVLIKAKPKNGP
jgi:hypothetical protein